MFSTVLSTLSVAATPPLQAFRRVHSVCSTCARPTASQGLRVVDASCAPNFTTTVDGCAAACANSTDCVYFGFLSVGKFEPHMGPCETYRFSEQYNLTVDDDPWQYWMKKETPGLAPDAARRAADGGGRVGHEGLPRDQGRQTGQAGGWLRADPKAPMRFVPTAAANVDFVPYFELDDEQMTVYPCYEI